MKILQLCNKIPYPPIDGGAIAILNLALTYSNTDNEVTILAMNTDKHQFNEHSIPEALRSKINFNYINVDTKIRRWQLLVNFIFSQQPYNATRFVSSAYAKKLKEILKHQTFDVIQLEGLYLKTYIKQIRKSTPAKIVYRAHNIESDIWKGLASSTKNILKRIYLKNLTKRVYRYEKGMLNQYDLLMPISKSDKQKLDAMGNVKPSHVCYPSISNENFRKNDSTQAPSNLFFIGALDWIPNQEGLTWFLDKVWRKLKEKTPELEFHIAGRNAPEWLVNKCKSAKTVFHGEVPSAANFFDTYDIMIVPLFSGSGIRIKIIEAMARSKTIVTTTIGAQGIPLIHPHDIIISNNNYDMRDQIMRLLNKPELYNKIRNNAYEFALKYFSEDKISAKLGRFCKDHNLC